MFVECRGYDIVVAVSCITCVESCHFFFDRVLVAPVRFFEDAPWFARKYDERALAL